MTTGLVYTDSYPHFRLPLGLLKVAGAVVAGANLVDSLFSMIGSLQVGRC